MRLIFINRFFYPDESATALMLTDLVTGLAPLGLERCVITAAGAYTPAHAAAAPSLKDVRVIRLPEPPMSSRSLAGRVFSFLAFYIGLAFAGLWHVRRGDIVICLTDPPLAGVLAAGIARLRGARLVHWVQDIYPETATRLGIGSPDSRAIAGLRWLRNWAWRQAVANVVIGERMRGFLEQQAPAPESIHLIQNWAEETQLVPLEASANNLRRAWDFTDDTIVVGYSGNLGRAHDAATMLAAAKLLPGAGAETIKFLFIGGGAKHDLLTAAREDATLAQRIALQPYRPRSELRESLSVPDIHWLSLEPELEGLIVPSKFYGAVAVGRPIIFIGDVTGEVARLIERAECGASFAKSDAQGVADYLMLLAGDLGMRDRLGANARTFSTEHLAQADRIRQWQELVGGIMDCKSRQHS